MKLPFKERTISTMVVIPSAIIVIALALLQYRWSAQVSESTAVRLADSLQMSMTNWQMDFFRYFSEIGLTLRTDPVEDAPGDVNRYVRRFAQWKAAARYPALVSNVYLLKGSAAASPPALRLNMAAGRFEPGNWPPQLEQLREGLRKACAEILRDRANTARAQNPGRTPGYALFDIGASAGWRFEPSIPALLHPIILGSAGSKGEANPETVDWIVIELSRQEIQTKVLPDLAQTYFQGTNGLDYQVAVVSVNPPRQAIYSSDPGFGNPVPTDADGIIDIFGRAQDSNARSPVHVFHAPSDNPGATTAVKISWFPLLRDPAESQDWQLVVRHRRGGPLGAFVGELHRRDLAIGFGVLLVLAVNMAMLIATSHRAQRLAQLQMNFVTAVSHELRTPLTVIISGADNICNGVVETKQQMMQYGSVIGNQARQLFGLVERILLFAATRQGRQRYQLGPLDVHEVIDAALVSAAGLIEASPCTVECDIAPDLPQVTGDASALSQCLQNLITNALKYGKEQHWLGIRASVHQPDSPGREVQISVSDRGIGISKEDLPHIFEPFYRSPSVRAAQIHGTGLGLPLSQSIAEAMNGRLTVISAPGGGSTFTLHLPCAESVIEERVA